jgi:hypothetical protein
VRDLRAGGLRPEEVIGRAAAAAGLGRPLQALAANDVSTLFPTAAQWRPLA